VARSTDRDLSGERARLGDHGRQRDGDHRRLVRERDAGGRRVVDAAKPRRRVRQGDGALLQWNPGANSSLGVFALTGDAATGNLFAGGDFTTIGGRSQQRYAEFTP